ncbi:Inosine-uridine preferring nucleoside hydrolase family protein [Perilla frutescens var. frutescens]|nr:Inosine-uridine preferring nucleoside hydrolase family protein [Perilla frutescens var. frutescens]
MVNLRRISRPTKLSTASSPYKSVDILSSMFISLRSITICFKVTVLTNGPLPGVAKIVLSDKKLSCLIEEIYVVGGQKTEKGNVINILSNEDAEFNMFLDPLAAKGDFKSRYNVTWSQSTERSSRETQPHREDTGSIIHNAFAVKMGSTEKGSSQISAYGITVLEKKPQASSSS